MTRRHRRCPLQGDVQVPWSRSPQSTVVVAVLRVAGGGTAQIVPFGAVSAGAERTSASPDSGRLPAVAAGGRSRAQSTDCVVPADGQQCLKRLGMRSGGTRSAGNALQVVQNGQNGLRAYRSPAMRGGEAWHIVRSQACRYPAGIFGDAGRLPGLGVALCRERASGCCWVASGTA